MALAMSTAERIEAAASLMWISERTKLAASAVLLQGELPPEMKVMLQYLEQDVHDFLNRLEVRADLTGR